MAGATYVLDKTYKCEVTAGLGKFVAVMKGTADEQVKLPTSAGIACIGITQGTAADGKSVAVRKLGISKAIALNAVTRGQYVEIGDTSGRLQAAVLTAGSAAVHHIVGMAETTVTTTGDIFLVLLTNNPVSVPAS